MLAQLKTVLIKEVITSLKKASFEYQHLWGWLQAQNGQKQKKNILKLSLLVLVLRN